MLFSSPSFLFLFLPIAIGLYLATGRSFAVLLAASFVFYGWGEPGALPLLFASILISFAAGRAIEANRAEWGRAAVWIGVGANMALLAFFKYAAFFTVNWNALAAAIGLPVAPIPEIPLPLGISFFTFQAVAYIVDVYRGTVSGNAPLARVALYKSVFPQLIAGPIVRYATIEPDLRSPRAGPEIFYLGLRRFAVGLGKKVILADTLGAIADHAFGLPAGELSLGMAWLGAVCFTLQIYFDFSGYSDMAIGLGLMLGLRLPENFAYPYTALSVREFWRRWHMSLSTWFRDYVYIPLGGNAHGPARTYFNLVVVFFLCGLWHGATWNFVVWGLYHGLFLAAERAGLGRLVDALPRPLGHAYVLLAVMVGWVIFRAPTLDGALVYLGVMFGAGGAADMAAGLSTYATGFVGLALALGVVGATPAVRDALVARFPDPPFWLDAGVVAALLMLALSFVATSTHQPFIYFRF